ncbi:hypothetical protein PIB30_049377 [Stylosanthes scabra]|uniref:Uncharacterized protein n=1 Tax=Stylosanthes scabra TaxID=79078 RepID=A0ABU6VFT8_9FABA|nr:hypothetical protein [Stylosanthes scabra]
MRIHRMRPSPIPHPSKSFGFLSHGIVRRDLNRIIMSARKVIELMPNEPWINDSEIPADVQKRWFEKWAEGFTWPEE